MAKLTASDRNSLSGSSFALPGRRYPIADASHARNALARVSQHGSPSEQARVRSAVHRKFPSIGKAEGGEVENSMDDLKSKARATALSRLRDWMDEEENNRLRVTIDIDPNPGVEEEEEEGEGPLNLVQEEAKEAKEHPELDEGTIEQIVEDHAAEKDEEEEEETEDDKKSREGALRRLFGRN